MMTDTVPTYLHASAAKAVAAMLFVAEELPARWDALYRETALFRRLPVDRLVIALYLADRHSLTTTARPVYGETWTAAWHGLEPQIALAVLRNHWSIHRRIPGYNDRTIHMTASADVVKEGACDREMLSTTDVASLLHGMDEMIEMEREQIERFHQSEDAWVKGRPLGIVDPRDMIGDEDEDAADKRREIEDTAANTVF